MPQFDTSVFGSQIVWTLVCFALLVAGMYGIIMPRFWKVRQQRQDGADKLCAQANSIRQQAETVLRSTEEAMKVTRQEARHMIEQAEQTVKDNVHRVRLEEERLGNQQMSRTREELQQLVIQTSGQLQNDVAHLAQMTIDQWAHPKSHVKGSSSSAALLAKSEVQND
jgi:F0F1-type ATP synthase membrane subunit b/b'